MESYFVRDFFFCKNSFYILNLAKPFLAVGVKLKNVQVGFITHGQHFNFPQTSLGKHFSEILFVVIFASTL